MGSPGPWGWCGHPPSPPQLSISSDVTFAFLDDSQILLPSICLSFYQHSSHAPILHHQCISPESFQPHKVLLAQAP